MKYKIAITVTLIMGLLLVKVIAAIGLVIVLVNDLLYWSNGVITLLAFVVAAFVIGYTMNKVVSRIKRLWE